MMTASSSSGASKRLGMIAIAAGSVAVMAACSGASGGDSEASESQDQKVYVRTSGGEYEEAMRINTWEPFTEETGIEVVPVSANTASILAMVESGDTTIDLIAGSEQLQLQLSNMGVLETLDAEQFELTDLDDITPVYDDYVGYNVYAEALTYNTEVYPEGPESWADFWDVDKFPGSRGLQDASVIAPNLEFALIADGVAMEDLYPLDIDRAFEKLEEIRPHVVKFYDSAALGAQLLTSEEAVMSSLWANRSAPLIEEGFPLEVVWAGAKLGIEGFSMLEDAPNKEAAYKLMDYSLQPEVQARTWTGLYLSPSNTRSFEYIDEDEARLLPTNPEFLDQAFFEDSAWWVENREEVNAKWQEYLVN